MFSATVLNHFAQPPTMGALEEADVVGAEGFPGQGPHMFIYLRLERNSNDASDPGADDGRAADSDDGRIAAARFETYGCPAAIACGSWLTQWIVGKTLTAAGEIEPNELMIAVGGLPLGKEHCAELAIKALRRALRKVHNRWSAS